MTLFSLLNYKDLIFDIAAAYDISGNLIESTYSTKLELELLGDTIPTKVSLLENDAKYITLLEVPEVNLTDYATKDEIPTKNSQLTNDSGFITLKEVPEVDLTNYPTKDQIPTKVGQLTNDVGYITAELVDDNVHIDLTPYAKKTELPTKTSDLTNDSGYITIEQVPETDLSDYAKKAEIPTKVTQLENDANYLTEHLSLEDYLKKLEAEELYLKKGDYALNSAIPTKVSVLDNDSEYITDTVLTSKNYATKLDVSDLVGSAPETLDTLKELADALGNDPNFAVTIAGEIGKKADSESVYTKDEVDSKITTELNRATTAETSIADDLSAKITKETEDRIAVNTTLEAKIDGLKYISDVQINGESAVTDKIANIDLTNYAKKSDLSSSITSSTITTTALKIPNANINAQAGDTNNANLEITFEGFNWGNKLAIPTLNNSMIELESTGKIPASAVNLSSYLTTDAANTYLTKTDASSTYADKETVTDQFTDINKKIDDINGLEELFSYGVEWDDTVASPELTRIGNPLLHKSLPIQSSYKGCVVKNGIILYYLDPNDWSKKEDGTDSVLDGTDGDVCVHIPKFYGKSGTNENKHWVRISTLKVDASWTEIPEMLVDAYRNTLHTIDNVTYTASVVNTTAEYRGGGNRSANDTYLETDKFKTDLGKPRTNLTRATMRKYAANSGKELLCYEYYKWIFYWNYVIEYANFNSLANYVADLTSDGYHLGGLGAGVTTYDGTKWNAYNGYYPLIPCGYCNDIGNFTGLKTATLDGYTFSVSRWRGFDNPFGDIWTILDGIVLKRDSVNADSNVYTTTDVSEFTDVIGNKLVAGIEKALDGWITQFALGSRGDIIPSKVGGSATTYMSDYHWCNASSTDLRLLLVGGGANGGSYAGLGCFHSYYGVGFSGASCGFRALRRI